MHVTPVLTSTVLNGMAGAQLFFKCENFQKTGAFKARGAVTHSSGNHGAALALAASMRGIPCTVVVPDSVLAPKRANIERYGARVVVCAPTLAAREATCAKVQAETGAHLVHPYNDAWVIAGQGTAAMELLEQAPELDMVIAPVGGGGLLSGTAIAAKSRRDSIQVIGAEPAGADDAARSLAENRLLPQPHPRTVADGLRGSLGDLTFAVIRQHVAAIVTVSEEEILAAAQRLWQVLKIVVEPSSAVAYAAIGAQPARFDGKRVGIVLTGGNVDLALAAS